MTNEITKMTEHFSKKMSEHYSKMANHRSKMSIFGHPFQTAIPYFDLKWLTKTEWVIITLGDE
jgi:hypothetical protein